MAGMGKVQRRSRRLEPLLIPMVLGGLLALLVGNAMRQRLVRLTCSLSLVLVVIHALIHRRRTTRVLRTVLDGPAQTGN